jgi:hypothetical protein
MLFNPQAERFTLLQLRNIAINMRPDLKERLDECLREKKFAQDMYVQCRKDEHSQEVFAAEMELFDDYIGRIDKTAYRHIIHHLLSQEVLYGFGTPLPITPQSAIEVIMPNYWLFLDLDPEKSEATGHGLHYVGIFFQQQENVPAETIALIKERQNNTSIATPLTPQSQQPSVDDNYYLSPYLRLMLEAAEYFDIDETNPPMKKYITDWLKEQSAKKKIELSERMVEILATAIRPPESQKGGLKAQSKLLPRGDNVKQPQDA